MAQRRVKLLQGSFPGRPAFDTAFSRALLHRAAAGDGPETFRLYRPDEVVAFSVLDRTRPGFRRAVAAAAERGCASVLRLAGGRAALFHAETLAFSWTVPDARARDRIHARFDAVAGLVAAALGRLGVDARIGEVPGEYCPGAHSVNAGGRVKLMGVGQRVVRGAAHVGGVIVVGRSRRVREILSPVYRALELEWDPATAGSVEDEVGPIPCREVADALLAELRRDHELEAADPEPDALALAADLESEHRATAPPPGAARRPGPGKTQQGDAGLEG